MCVCVCTEDLESGGERVDGLEIEVVCGFVEDDDVRLGVRERLRL